MWCFSSSDTVALDRSGFPAGAVAWHISGLLFLGGD